MNLRTASLFFIFLTSIAHGSSERLDLTQTLRYAIEHSPTLDSARRESLVSELEYKNSVSRFLPSLDASATHGIEDSNPSSRATPWASRLNLTLTENLYDNGTNVIQLRSAELRRELSSIAFLRTRDLLIRDVAAEYFRFSLTSKLLEIQKTQFELLKNQYDRVQRDYQSGRKTHKDYLRFKTQIGRAEIDLGNTNNTITRSRQDLRNLVAVPLHLNGSEGPDFLPVDPDHLTEPPVIKEAPDLKIHYEYRIADLQRKIDEQAVTLSRRRNLPQAFISGSLAYQAQDYLDTPNPIWKNDSLSWNALLTLKYNILDWGISNRDVAIAEQRQSIQSNALEKTLLTTRSEIEKLMLDLQQLHRNYGLSRELLALEKRNYDSLSTDYRNGKVSYLDLITGLRDLSDAQIKLYTSLFELQQTTFNYRYHEGRLHDSIFSQ